MKMKVPWETGGCLVDSLLLLYLWAVEYRENFDVEKIEETIEEAREWARNTFVSICKSIEKQEGKEFDFEVEDEDEE